MTVGQRNRTRENLQWELNTTYGTTIEWCKRANRRVAICKPGKPGLTSFSETLALFLIQFLSFRKMKLQDRQNYPSKSFRAYQKKLAGYATGKYAVLWLTWLFTKIRQNFEWFLFRICTLFCNRPFRKKVEEARYAKIYKHVLKDSHLRFRPKKSLTLISFIYQEPLLNIVKNSNVTSSFNKKAFGCIYELS